LKKILLFTHLVLGDDYLNLQTKEFLLRFINNRKILLMIICNFSEVAFQFDLQLHRFVVLRQLPEAINK